MSGLWSLYLSSFEGVVNKEGGAFILVIEIFLGYYYFELLRYLIVVK